MAGGRQTLRDARGGFLRWEKILPTRPDAAALVGVKLTVRAQVDVAAVHIAAVFGAAVLGPAGRDQPGKEEQDEQDEQNLDGEEEVRRATAVAAAGISSAPHRMLGRHHTSSIISGSS